MYKQGGSLYVPKINKTVDQKSYFFLGHRHFNSLPTRLRTHITYFSTEVVFRK